jgi:Spy/CpxP family protein refolding chaperone
MKSKIVAIGLVVALLLCAGVVLAQRGRQPMKPAGPPAMAPGGGDGMCMGMGMLGKMSKELNLSADQVAQLKTIQKGFMDSTQATRTDIQAMMKQMMELWMADQPDAGAIKDLAGQLDALRAQIRNSAIDHAVSGIGVLTADQRAKLREIIGKNPGMCMGMGCGLACGVGMGGPGMGCPMGGPGMGRGMGGPGMGGPGAGKGMGGPGKGMGPGAGGANCPYAK